MYISVYSTTFKPATLSLQINFEFPLFYLMRMHAQGIGLYNVP